MIIEELNHVALYVRDLDKSIRFYGEDLEMEAIARPAFTFPGAWFRLGGRQELHLIGNREAALSLHKQHHFALKVASASDTALFLERKGIQYIGPKPRPDGALQIFIQDPDGYYIELFELFKPEQ